MVICQLDITLSAILGYESYPVLPSLFSSSTVQFYAIRYGVLVFKMEIIIFRVYYLPFSSSIGVIVSYILESVKQIFSDRIGNTIYHCINGVVYASVLYRFVT